MFERLFLKLLKNVLAQYFEFDGNDNGIEDSLTASVWSGYITLDNLTVKRDVLKDDGQLGYILASKGFPIEVLSCGIRRLEISVPWAKISSPIKTTQRNNRSDKVENFSTKDGAIVIVIDGVHLLMNTRISRDNNQAMENERIKRRREQLEAAVDRSKQNNGANSSSYTFSSFLKDKLALGLNLASAGIMSDMLERIQLHLRNVHVRIEDCCVSDSSHPFAFGLTLESMHVQNHASETQSSKRHNQQSQTETSTKIIQVHHFGFYWNSMIEKENFGDASTTSTFQKYKIPTPFSVLGHMKDQEELSRTMLSCIARRSTDKSESNIFSPSYMILPIDANCRLSVSKDPRNCQFVPAVELHIVVDSIDFEIRKVHYHQIIQFISMVKNYLYSQQFLRHRPKVSVKENPRAWWRYVLTVVRLQLKERNAWSWDRFSHSSVVRKRYFDLYERKLVNDYFASSKIKSSFSSLGEVQVDEVGKDKTDGSLNYKNLSQSQINELTTEEEIELQMIEDGINGEILVDDILAYRLAVKSKIAKFIKSSEVKLTQSHIKRQSFVRYIKTWISDDVETSQEYERLLDMLDNSFEDGDFQIEQSNPVNVAIRINLELKKCSVSFSTQVIVSNPSQSLFSIYYQRVTSQHHSFLVLSMKHFTSTYELYDDYSAYTIDLALGYIILHEIGSDGEETRILSRCDYNPGENYEANYVENEGEKQRKSNNSNSDESSQYLLTLTLQKNPLNMFNRDISITGRLEKLEFYLCPEMNFLTQLKATLMPHKKFSDPSEFWRALKLASINSLKKATSKWMAKADLATENKNIELNIFIDAPLVIIDGGLSTNLFIDLGKLRLTTIRLAGLTNSVSHKSSVAALDNSSESIENALHAASLSLSPSCLRHNSVDSIFEGNSRRMSFSDQFSLGPGSISMISHNAKRSRKTSTRSMSESTFFDGLEGGLNEENVMKSSRKKSAKLWQDNFYDVFQVKIDFICVSLSNTTKVSRDYSKESMRKILHETSVDIILEKSVIPFDHTLSKFKVKCSIEDVKVTVSSESIKTLCILLNGWTMKKSNSTSTLSTALSSNINDTRSCSPSLELEDSEGDSGDEFLDALDQAEDMASSRDSWQIDNIGGYGMFPSNNYNFDSMTNTREKSIHSSSERSLQNIDSSILNEKNLAALAEDSGNVEASPTPSETALSQISSESFHSALSIGDNYDLVYALHDDILRANDEKLQLQRDLESATNKRTKISLQLELLRIDAEVRALQNSYNELINKLATAKNEGIDKDTESSINDVDNFNLITGIEIDKEVAMRAKALLQSRSKRSLDVLRDNANDHSVTIKLNRDFCFISCSVKTISCDILSENNFSQDQIVFSLSFRSLGVSLHKRSFDTQMSAYLSSLEVFDSSVELENEKFLILNGESIVPVMPSLSLGASEVRQPKLGRDHFLNFFVHKRNQHDDGKKRHDKAMRCKVAVGLFEIALEEQSLRRCLKICNLIKVTILGMNDDSRQASKTPLYEKILVETDDIKAINSLRKIPSDMHALIKCSIFVESFRFKVHNEFRQHALTLSGKELNFSFSKSASFILKRNRSQILLHLKNLQLLDTSENQELPSMLFGRGDTNKPFLQFRVRAQLVPENEADGWVVDSPQSVSTLNDSLHGIDSTVWNFHVGLTMYNPLVSLSTSTIINALSTLLSLRKAFSLGSGDTTNSDPVNEEQISSSFDQNEVKLRWRIDCEMFCGVARVNLSSDFNSDLCGDVCLSFQSLNLSAEKFDLSSGHIIIANYLNDVSLEHSREAIIMPLSIRLDLLVPNFNGSKQSHVYKPHALMMPPSSKWSWCTKCNLESSLDLNDIKMFEDNGGISCALTSSILTLNLSAKSLSSLFEKLLKMNNMISAHSKGVNQKQGHFENLSDPKVIRLLLNAPKIQLNLKSGKCMTSPILQFVIHNPNLSLYSLIDKGKLHKAIIEADIKSAELFDLVSSKQVQVMKVNSSDNLTPVGCCVKFDRICDKNISPICLNVEFGFVQSVVLPSTLIHLLEFKDDFKKHMDLGSGQKRDVDEVNVNNLEILASILESLELPFDATEVNVTLNMEKLDMVFPTREISSCFNADDLIGAIALRMNTSLLSKFIICREYQDIEESIPLSQKSGFSQWTEQLDHIASHNQSFINRFSRFGIVDIIFKTPSIQILRTCLKSEDSNLEGNKNSKIYLFQTRVPLAGEQQIVSPTCLMLNLTSTWTTIKVESSKFPRLCTSNAFKVDMTLLDILVYVEQTKEGINQAYRVSVKPFIDRMKSSNKRTNKCISRKDDVNIMSNIISQERDKSDQSQGSLDVHQVLTNSPKEFKDTTSVLLKILRRSVFVAAIDVAGLQITLVPGGATLLTESPMMKFAVTRLKLGLAATSVPRNNVLKDSLKSGLLTSFSRTVNKTMKRFSEWNCAAWLTCEVSAHYHNRRLVAWEPFVERWILHGRIGANLLQVFNLPVIEWEDSVPLGTTMSASNSDQLIGRGPIRDFQRLLQLYTYKNNDTSSAPANSSLSITDMSHQILFFFAAETLDEALYQLPKIESTTLVNSRELCKNRQMILCGGQQREWLHLHGFPMKLATEKNATHFDDIIVSLEDVVQLNINVTGALLENVLMVILHDWNGHNAHTTSMSSMKASPHLIRNSSGHTLHYSEQLETDRLNRGEVSEVVSIFDGHEKTLFLKRSLSQTCDPHQAYLRLEVDPCFSNDESFRPIDRIPVDMVGVYSFPLVPWGDLSPNESQRSIIVRVDLLKGTKIVTIESSLIFKNVTETALHCMLKSVKGNIVWENVIPPKNSDNNEVALPCGLVEDCVSMTVVSLQTSTEQNDAWNVLHSESKEIEFQSIYSENEKCDGLVRSLRTSVTSIGQSCIDVEICLFRIGREQLSSVSQKLIIFRPPYVIKNYLPSPMAIQIRPKTQYSSIRKSFSTRSLLSANLNTFTENHFYENELWINLGIIDCGEMIQWSGPVPVDGVDLRIKLLSDCKGSTSNSFPFWSSSVTIQDGLIRNHEKDGIEGANDTNIPSCKIMDADGVILELLTSIEFDKEIIQHDIKNPRELSALIDPASTVVAIHVPFWICNETGSSLEYAAESGTLINRKFTVAGQHILQAKSSKFVYGTDVKMMDDYVTSPLEIFMVGNMNAKKLRIRREILAIKESNASHTDKVQPWSNSFPISSARRGGHYYNVAAHSIKGAAWYYSSCQEELSLSTRVVQAPAAFGGNHGTILVHLRNRYTLVNTLQRNIEIVPCDHSYGHSIRGNKLFLRADGNYTPFHINDLDMVRIRPVEYGWSWSGPFSLRSNSEELIMRLRHKFGGQAIIVTVEYKKNLPAPGCTIIFRQTEYPPFRLENESLRAFNFYQYVNPLNAIRSKLPLLFRNIPKWDSRDFLLPYQKVPFAWYNPEKRNQLLVIEMRDIDNNMNIVELGRFRLDKIIPGTELNLHVPGLVIEVLADGPTRVLRIIDATLPKVKEKSLSISRMREISFLCRAKFKKGAGISIVDWQPQELCYLRFNEISLETNSVGIIQNNSIKVKSIVFDNQLWITPYPVLLQMGTRIDLMEGLGVDNKKLKRTKDAIDFQLQRTLHDPDDGIGQTTLYKVNLSMQPLVLKVDGYLIRHLLVMSREVSTFLYQNRGGKSKKEYKDEILFAALGLQSDSQIEQLKNGSIFNSFSFSSFDKSLPNFQISLMESHAFELNFVKMDDSMHSMLAFDNLEDNDILEVSVAEADTLSAAPRKLYLEELLISPIKVDLSYSGLLSEYLALPISFEGAPIFLRPYAMRHAYGTLSEFLRDAKLHYINWKRLMDLVVNLFLNPLFMLPATWRTIKQMNSSYFKLISDRAALNSEKLKRAEMNLKPITPMYLSSAPKALHPLLALPYNLFWGSFRLSLQPPSAFLWIISGITSRLSQLLTVSQQHLDPINLIRSRPPRLFVSQEGKDLLVDYVHGHNAGKALLSRVRNGIYLGEGYVYHCELANVNTVDPKLSNTPRTEVDSAIVLLTFHRLLLLKVKGNLNLFSITSDILLDSVVFIEMSKGIFLSTNQNSNPSLDQTCIDDWAVIAKFDRVKLWYFSSDEVKYESLSIQSSALETQNTLCGGMLSLKCQTFLWETELDEAQVFVEEMRKMKPEICIGIPPITEEIIATKDAMIEQDLGYGRF